MTTSAVTLPAAGWPLPAASMQRRSALGRAAAAALLVHGVVAWCLLAPPSRGAGAEDSGRIVHVRAVQFIQRTAELARPPEPAPEIQAPAVSSDPAPAVAAVPARSLATPSPLVEPGVLRSSADSGARPSLPPGAAPSPDPQVAANEARRETAQTAPATAAAPPALPPAPDYLSGGRLDPGPRPIGDVKPDYPAEAKLQEGTVVLRVLIAADGSVDDVAVVRSYPKDLFDAAALAAWKAARFEPGRMLGVPMKSQMTIEQRFTPINRGQISTRSY